MRLIILYRGPLASCNYGCFYCPFAKHKETLAERKADTIALAKFVEWCAMKKDWQLSILFTPWGEALNRSRYQQALITLSNLNNIEKVVIQTNLSARLDWISNCDLNRLALWTTYHPQEVTRVKFLDQCRKLDKKGVRYSVGMVGLKDYFDEIATMRKELLPEIYLWINAYKDREDYYSNADKERLNEIDPLFLINTMRHQSMGHSCRAGESVISVDGEGFAYRCHFIKQPIGNLYQDNFEDALYQRDCTNLTCSCHIGYIHLRELNLYQTFAGGLLERIPAHWPIKIGEGYNQKLMI